MSLILALMMVFAAPADCSGTDGWEIKQCQDSWNW
jgi:hypothetical protein